GHNWSGLVMMVRDGHQLVQRGPYAIVRHPIYTGLFAAILGTALTLGTLASWMAVVSGLAGILLRVDVEERLMASEFGDAHAAYRAPTPTLSPCGRGPLQTPRRKRALGAAVRRAHQPVRRHRDRVSRSHGGAGPHLVTARDQGALGLARQRALGHNLVGQPLV